MHFLGIVGITACTIACGAPILMEMYGNDLNAPTAVLVVYGVIGFANPLHPRHFGLWIKCQKMVDQRI